MGSILPFNLILTHHCNYEEMAPPAVLPPTQDRAPTTTAVHTSSCTHASTSSMAPPEPEEDVDMEEGGVTPCQQTRSSKQAITSPSSGAPEAQHTWVINPVCRWFLTTNTRLTFQFRAPADNVLRATRHVSRSKAEKQH
jgi:hypothetical protein